MKKWVRKRLTAKRATILLSIVMAALIILLTIYLIVSISSNSFEYPIFVLLYGAIFAIAPSLGACIGSIKSISKNEKVD